MVVSLGESQCWPPMREERALVRCIRAPMYPVTTTTAAAVHDWQLTVKDSKYPLVQEERRQHDYTYDVTAGWSSDVPLPAPEA